MSDMNITQNCSIGLVGKDINFKIFDEAATQGYVSAACVRLHITFTTTTATMATITTTTTTNNNNNNNNNNNKTGYDDFINFIIYKFQNISFKPSSIFLGLLRRL